MSRDRLKAAERLAMDIAAPLPAIMTLVAANEDATQAAIKILLQDVDNKAAELCEVLSGLQVTELPRSA